MSSRRPERSHRIFRPHRWILSALILALPWPVLDVAEAQTPARDQEVNPTAELFERPTEIRPQSGPPGTRVTVRGLHLPALTPVNIGFGGTQSGFEGVAFVLTNRHGVVEETVVVPEWAAREESHRFIIFDAYFDPISMTEQFHVTDAEGTLVREGEVVERRSECAAMKGADQDLYYLLGDVVGVEVGDHIIVEARIVQSSECGDGVHLESVSSGSSARRLQRPSGKTSGTVSKRRRGGLHGFAPCLGAAIVAHTGLDGRRGAPRVLGSPE